MGRIPAPRAPSKRDLEDLLWEAKRREERARFRRDVLFVITAAWWIMLLASLLLPEG